MFDARKWVQMCSLLGPELGKMPTLQHGEEELKLRKSAWCMGVYLQLFQPFKMPECAGALGRCHSPRWLRGCTYYSNSVT